jgi:hypothetical protein
MSQSETNLIEPNVACASPRESSISVYFLTTASLSLQQIDLQPVDDGQCNLVLDGKDILHVTVETLGPEVVAIRDVDELGGDSKTVA